MAEEQKQFSDVNNRVKARVRPTVPPRDNLLFRKRQADENLEDVEAVILDPPIHEQKFIDKLETPKLAVASEETEKLVSFTLRVEDIVDKGLKSICTNESITKETFLEAAYLVCNENEQVMQKVLEVAKARRAKRRKTGNLRRAESMAKYLP